MALDISAELNRADKSSWGIKKRLLAKEACDLIYKVGHKLAGVKINNQLILSLGLYDFLPSVIDAIESNDLPAVADCKVNDVGHTNEWITRHFLNAGFDALIANPFVGWTGGLDKVFEISRSRSTGVILLVYMSHPASAEGYGQLVIDPSTGETRPQYIIFAEKANKWKSDGVIVGATAPEKIREIHNILDKNIPIICPGVGAQGGDLEKAINAGASYLIVGRTVFGSDNPESTLNDLNRRIKSIFASS